MTTMQKVKPCPECGDEEPNLYTYDNGWRHVECDVCFYLGPGAGNKIDAVRLHNAMYAEAIAAREVSK